MSATISTPLPYQQCQQQVRLGKKIIMICILKDITTLVKKNKLYTNWVKHSLNTSLSTCTHLHLCKIQYSCQGNQLEFVQATENINLIFSLIQKKKLAKIFVFVLFHFLLFVFHKKEKSNKQRCTAQLFYNFKTLTQILLIVRHLQNISQNCY